MADAMATAVQALRLLRQEDPWPLSQGLSPAGARLAWEAALDVLDERAMRAAVVTPGPGHTTIVVARGVFTSPLEWVALHVAAGRAVHVKAPRDAGEACVAIALAFRTAGAQVTVGTERDLPATDLVLAFGSDASVDAVAQAAKAPVRRYGHRFSAAFVRGAPDARTVDALVLDHVLYDTRGCMAPAVVAVDGPVEAWGKALALGLEQAEGKVPRGECDPLLGPEWRRRTGLGRVKGRAWEGPAWAVVAIPQENAVPVALPRLVTLVPSADLRFLEPWAAHASSLATQQNVAGEAWFSRVVEPGELQRPRVPRRHDGLPML